jgi:hypothetical protein
MFQSLSETGHQEYLLAGKTKNLNDWFHVMSSVSVNPSEAPRTRKTTSWSKILIL